MSLFISQSTIYELAPLSILAFALLVQLFYYLYVYIQLLFNPKKSNPKTADLPPVSVVICARNEEQNLEQFLPLVLEQDYPNFEVVVVNDCSFDDSDMVLKRLSEKYSHLKVTTIKPDEKFTHGKKLALTIGIKAAKNEWVLLTDADCRPESKNWITCMASKFGETNEVVLGYGGYIPTKGLLNKFIRFDTLFIAMQYIGFAIIGKPYMGVGRNLAYRRDLFFRNKGFASHATLNSGDDDLFVQQVASGKNTTVSFGQDSITRSVACKSFKQWVLQKQRHLTTAPHYRFSTQLLLSLEPLTRLLFWITGISLIVMQYNIQIILGVMAFRILVIHITLKLVMNRLNERKIFILSLLYDLFAPLLFGTLMLANLLTQKRSKWN